MDSGWKPANEIERDLALAVNAGDTREYARKVLSAELFLPVPPEEDDARTELARELGLEFDHVLAFTSLAGMSTVLGERVREYHKGDFATLARFWPNPGVVLALNPGLPINASLPLNVLTGLADGDESLVGSDDVRAVLNDEVDNQIRRRRPS
ncbi:hypothetical protein [Amycolatopsis taiwanensis]|uniref:hypothetical protein n=1 Tax=Amycolatopsis taiwanensis TaxID=342230 RepID=UPI0004849363|nr:hypothetical protein [Amycolatopsis taiwanensis]